MAINVKDKLVTVESLGIAYSTEQGARQEADQALSTRIDNIVAPDGDPSLTEVSDARVSGSTTHNTLKARLDADQAAIETEISGINESMDDIKTQVGDLSELETSEKSSLVGAINEAAQSGGSEITVDDTLTTAGAAADAKKTGDEISGINESLDDVKADLEDLDNDVNDLKSVVEHCYIETSPVSQGSFSKNGTLNTTNLRRIRTGLIPVEVGDKIVIHNGGTLGHACGAWNGTPSDATNVRNDNGFSYVDETIVSEITGYYVIVFAKSDLTQNITLSEFDGYIRLYSNSIYRNSQEIEEIKSVLGDMVKQTRNIFTEEWGHFEYSNTGIYKPTTSMRHTACPPNISVVGGETYTISWGEITYKEGTQYMYIHQFNDDGERVRFGYYQIASGFATLTLEQSTTRIGLMVYISGNVGSLPTEWTELVPEWTQVEAGSVKTEFVSPYAIEPSLIDNESVYSGIKPLLKEDISINTISRTVKTIAHRGDDVLAPQCTAPAYIMARKNGIFIAENDLWLSEDGEFVMWHDITLARLGNLVDINGYLMYTDGTNYYYVNDSVVYTWDGTDYVESSVPLSSLTRCAGADYGVNSTYASIGLPLSVLKRIDFGVYKGSQFAGTQILTLEEWVMLCKQLGMEIYIDKKLNYTDALLTEAANIVKKCGMGNYASWLGVSDVGQIDLLRTIIPDARVGVLTHPNSTNIVTYADKNIGMGFFFNGDAKNGMTAEAIQLGLNAGFDVEVWYVDFGNATENQILGVLRDAISCGVTAITTDHYRADDAYSYLLEEY